MQALDLNQQCRSPSLLHLEHLQTSPDLHRSQEELLSGLPLHVDINSRTPHQAGKGLRHRAETDPRAHQLEKDLRHRAEIDPRAHQPERGGPRGHQLE
jgi:hypothetical protein